MQTRLVIATAGAVFAVILALVAYGTPRADRISIHYVIPQEPAHQFIYEQMTRRGALEELQLFLSPLILPRTLRIQLAECDGEADAFYDFASITICYELIADLWANMPAETTPSGIQPIDTVIGPLFEISLHEVAHALFDLLKLPLLGREEDAADQVAAYVLLQLGDDEARRLITGAAFAYKIEELRSGDCRSIEDYAGEHSTPAQRAFNAMCIAYGADRRLFSDLVTGGWLPEARAEWCFEEYEQVQDAFEILIHPHIDQHIADEIRGRNWLCDRQNERTELTPENCLLAPAFASTAPEERSDENSRAAHAELLVKARQGTIDVYFIGDSITRRWGALDYPEYLEHWNDTFFGWNTANFAWGGDRTQNILWRLQNGELDGLNPRVFAIQAGTNNLNPDEDKSYQVDSITAGVIEIVNTARAAAPEARVILTGLFVRQEPEYNSIIQAVNGSLERYAAQENLHYLDINESLRDPDGKLRSAVTDDGLHLDLEGYRVWANALVPVLTDILGPPAESDDAPPATGNPAAQ